MSISSLTDQKLSEFDLTPDPRVLSMLGEINLAEWKCLAELIDNSVDGFLAAQRAGFDIQLPQVSIVLPLRDDPGARISVNDNGPGMSPETLERSMKAGFSGNDPIGNLGLFGMGFNIATARLGLVTRVFSARTEDAEWSGLEIDFEALAQQRNFRTPRLTRPKANPLEHGTRVEITKVKPAARRFFAGAANRSRVNKELGRIYSAMLRANGTPVHFLLKVNGNKISGRQHCVWNEERATHVADLGEVSAIQPIDMTLGARQFCKRCWSWLGAHEDVCPGCATASQVVSRPRRVHGWLGIQRYAHTSDFGIDFLRNGRKIEIANKDLFSWSPDDTEAPEKEYPIDDPRNRGRIVGEIHLDHCRVAYTKDRFDRNDVAWGEMLEIVRGNGPLLPRKAADRGFEPNTSPLARLHRAYRRNSPYNQAAGAYRRILFVKDNDHAEDMAKKYHDGDPEYRDDHKWWELVEEADRDLLLPPTDPAAQHPSSLTGFTRSPQPNGSEPGASVGSGQPTADDYEVESPAPSPVRRPIPSLSAEYTDEITHRRWVVEAFEVDATDPELQAPSEPWSMSTSPSGISSFFVNLSHSVFRSSTMTPLDALLTQLASNALDTMPRSIAERPSLARVMCSLRLRYARQYRLEPDELSADANHALVDIARGIAEGISNAEGRVFFNELSSSDQEATQRRMASQAVANSQAVIDDGRFLEYAPKSVLIDVFDRHPELFFDGRYWDTEYAGLDYGTDEATEIARSQVVSDYRSLLLDAVWLDDRDPSTLGSVHRARLVRAAAALDLIRRDSETLTR